MPILFILKLNNTLYLCVDYRGLNTLIIKNRYPLLLISEIMDYLARVKVYSQLDL